MQKYEALIEAEFPKNPESVRGPARRYDWRPDLPDHRDFLFAQVRPTVETERALPARIDLREGCSPVVNQGQIGSCTGNALSGLLEFLELKALREEADPRESDREAKRADGQTLAARATRFAAVSRLFIYYNERVLEGRPEQDAGATLRDGIKSLVKWGYCRESLWKYLPSQVFAKPSASAYKDGKTHNLTSYRKLTGLGEVRACLAEGFPLVFGFSVYESFESAEVARTGKMPLPRPDERLLGGHAVMVAGYDDAASCFIVRNSWGAEWGDGGYFEMPYAYFTELRLVQDIWTVRADW